MQTPETNLNKLYNATASVIMDLSFNKKISEAEMLFLLNLLDMIWEANNDNFITKLIEWYDIEKTAEMEEIIKQTMISIDFNDPQAIQGIINMLQELLLQAKIEG